MSCILIYITPKKQTIT